MLRKKIGSVKNLAKKAKIWGGNESTLSERLLRVHEYEEKDIELSSSCSSGTSCKTPKGFFTVYVGVERRKFVVPMAYLSHPLFKMMLEKSSDEFGFDQKNGLVLPCSVDVFQEVVNAVELCNGKCDLSRLVEEFVN